MPSKSAAGRGLASTGRAAWVGDSPDDLDAVEVGTGVLLFASVLERFLALYASVNSFTQLIARTSQSERYLKKWPPRAGEQTML